MPTTRTATGKYWPGGSGGGGKKKRQATTPVVLPHARTTPSCRECTRYHTTRDHEQHLKAMRGRPKLTKPTKPTKPTKKTRMAPSPKTIRKNAERPSAPIAARPAPVPLSSADRLAVTLSAIPKIQGDGRRFGDRKVFISALWDAIGDRLNITRSEFNAWLMHMHQASHLVLARADFVSGMNPESVRRSEIAGPRGIPTFHFVTDKTVR